MLSVLKRTFSWKLYCFVVLAGVLVILPNAQLMITEYIGNSLPAAIEHRQFDKLIALLAVQAGIFALIQLCIALNKILETQLSSQYKCLLEEKVHTKLSNVKITLLERSETHNQIMALSNTLQHLGFPLLKHLIQFAKSSLTIAVMLYVMRNIHWSVLAIIVTVSFLHVFAIRKYFRKQMEIYMQTSEPSRKAKYYAGLLIDRELVGEVRTFQLNSFILSKWKSLFFHIEKMQVRLTNKQDLLLGSLQMISQALQFMMLLILVLFTSFTVGTYLMVTQGLLQLQNMAHELVESVNRLQETSVYLPSFFKVMELEEEEQDERLLPFQGLKREIKLENVSFRYPNAASYALKQINIEIKAGEKVAIVGHNGSGKTTLVKCLLGIYDHYEGEIFLDGIPMRHYDKKSVRAHLSVLLQHFGKYPLSLRDNISLHDGEGGGHADRLLEAVRLSDASGFADGLPNGIETPLNPVFGDGVDLSGGQWQKIGLARAYYKNSDIVILDEPTAAIDPLSEDRLFEGMLAHLQNKTALILTHRLGICRQADKIIVMDGGEVVEMGSHDRLMSRGGYYKRMYETQAKWYVHAKEGDLYPVPF